MHIKETLVLNRPAYMGMIPMYAGLLRTSVSLILCTTTRFSDLAADECGLGRSLKELLLVVYEPDVDSFADVLHGLAEHAVIH